MAFTPSDFSFIARAQQPDLGLRDAVKNYYAGYQAEQESAYRPQMLEATIAEKLANAAKAKYWSPFTGTAGNLYALDQLEKVRGSEDPTLQAIRKQIELQQEHEKATTDYQRKVAQNLFFSRMTPLDKKFAELDLIDQGKAFGVEGDVIELTPGQRIQRRLAKGKDLINEITDPALRARVQFGNNMLTTFNSIDPDKAFARSGGWGAIANALEKGTSSFTGKQSEAFESFQKELPKLKILAKQASQFMDAPAAAEIQEGIEEIANPNSWRTNPKLAKEKFETFKSLMEQEHGNILRSVMSSEPYGVNFAQSAPREGAFPQSPDATSFEQEVGNQFGAREQKAPALTDRIEIINAKLRDGNMQSISMADIQAAAQKSRKSPEEILNAIEMKVTKGR